MTRGVPMLDPKHDLAGATPVTLARALLRNTTRREWLKGTRRGGTQRQGSHMRNLTTPRINTASVGTFWGYEC